MVGRFETIAYDVVSSHGGRVVKMIGDEVMFLHDEPRAGAALALDLAERYRDDDDLSDVRVGLACGRVLERDGDVYGPVVNLANRIVSVALPGHGRGLGGARRRARGRRRVRPAVVALTLPPRHRAGAAVHVAPSDRPSRDTPYSRARHRRSRREFLRERWVDLQTGAERRSAELPEPIAEELLAPAVDPSTGQFEALTEAVLEADLDTEMQVALLSDLEAARRLRELENEAEQKADAADSEAERQLEEIERDARQRVEDAEREARKRIEQVLAEAEEKSRKVNEEASRKVKRVAEEVERKADRATRDAAKDAKARADRRAKGRRPRKKDES